MNKQHNNLLYFFLQRKLLEAVNNINFKMNEESKITLLDELKDSGKLKTELSFKEAKVILNKYHNIPYRVLVPCLYVMKNLELIEITGQFNHMKVKVINIHRGNFIKDSNKLYSICL